MKDVMEDNERQFLDETFGVPTPADFGYRRDNPGGDWLARKQHWSEEDSKGKHRGLAHFMAAGAVTAWMGADRDKPMYMGIDLLRHIPGANDEQYYRKPGDIHFDDLQQSVRDNGWKQQYPIMIRVNHLGRAVIMEGNTRATIARLHGVRDVKVSFQWMNGGEDAENDLWSPQRVASLCATEPRPFEPKHFWNKELTESEDSYNPQPMTEPKVLYRSVSIPELENIHFLGRVMGGKNKFNDFDSRKFVFFGDTMSDNLIQQGEETERQASYRMQSHRIHSEFRRLADDHKEQAMLIGHLLKKAKVDLTPEEETYLEAGYMSPIRDRISMVFGPTRRLLQDALDDLDNIEDDQRELQSKYYNLYQSEHELVKAGLVPKLITSAVLVTKPLTGGMHYSSAHGRSGMGDEDEYGFESGEVALDDIQKIILIGRGKIIGEITPDELPAKIDRIMRVWQGQSL